jgi:UDP-N-acetylglucosamine transferase subunit ALG13
MIFVSVGTGKFDELTEAVDKIAPSLKERIIAQIGEGGYKPKNIEYFRYKETLLPYDKKARLIITHGGAGRIYELLAMNKRIIGLANTNRTDDHQIDILKALSQQDFLIWCKDLDDLKEIIKNSRKFRLKRYKKPECSIAEKIRDYIKKV